MMQKSETSVFTEKEAHQHEQSLEEIRSGRLGAFTVMMQIDSDIQEEMKRDPLCKSDLLADFGKPWKRAGGEQTWWKQR